MLIPPTQPAKPRTATSLPRLLSGWAAGAFGFVVVMLGGWWFTVALGLIVHLGLLELESGEYFDVLRADDRLVFGGPCNTCFLESGYILREPGETDDELLAELLADLEVFYRDGLRYVSRIVVNKRM